jgi:hypothetical protein
VRLRSRCLGTETVADPFLTSCVLYLDTSIRHQKKLDTEYRAHSKKKRTNQTPSHRCLIASVARNDPLASGTQIKLSSRDREGKEASEKEVRRGHPSSDLFGMSSRAITQHKDSEGNHWGNSGARSFRNSRERDEVRWLLY